jgi:peptidoglycan/LPS O-acetylase OafA/YrhL
VPGNFQHSQLQAITAKAEVLRSPAIRLSSIEACRGIAAVMVVCCHTADILGSPANFGFHPFGSLFQFGRSGVDFFFVLSGFLIALIHWKDIGRPDKLKHYALRRLTRIYPTYWLILLLIIPFDIFTHTLFDNYNEPIQVIKSIFLIPQDLTILDVTWSLRNELLFYILFGLMIFKRRIGYFIIIIWIIGLSVRSLASFSINDPWLDLLTYPMNFEFVIGVLAGWAFPRIRISYPATILAFGAVTLLALWVAEDHMLLFNLPWRLFLLRSFAYGIAVALLIVGLSALELQKRLRIPQPLVLLGGASYLLYLVHVPALLILGSSERHLHLLRFAPAWLLATVFIAITIAGAVLMHLIVEKPLLRTIRNGTAKILMPSKSIHPKENLS